MTAAQGRLVAFAFGQLVIGTVPFQGLPGELFTAFFSLSKKQRVAIVFKLRSELGCEAAFQQQTRALQVVVSAGGRAGAGAETQGELADDRMFRHQAGVLLIRGFAQLGEDGLVVGEHQHMAFPGMLVVPRDTILGTQPLDELEVIFRVLSAVPALVIRSDAEGESIGLNAMPLEDLSDNLRHRQVLKKIRWLWLNCK